MKPLFEGAFFYAKKNMNKLRTYLKSNRKTASTLLTSLASAKYFSVVGITMQKYDSSPLKSIVYSHIFLFNFKQVHRVIFSYFFFWYFYFGNTRDCIV